MKMSTKINLAKVDSLVPMLVWWNAELISREYANSRKAITCAELFETNEECFKKVIGRLPDDLCPEPHRALQDCEV